MLSISVASGGPPLHRLPGGQHFFQPLHHPEVHPSIKRTVILTSSGRFRGSISPGVVLSALVTPYSAPSALTPGEADGSSCFPRELRPLPVLVQGLVKPGGL